MNNNAVHFFSLFNCFCFIFLFEPSEKQQNSQKKKWERNEKESDDKQKTTENVSLFWPSLNLNQFYQKIQLSNQIMKSRIQIDARCLRVIRKQ